MNKKIGLSSPALVTAIASSPSGQKAITNTLDKTEKTVKTTYTLLKYAVGIGVVGFVGYWGFNKLFDGFTKLREDTRFTPANISTGIALSKANAIYDALYGLGSNFSKVQTALTGVNHNGLIRIYNEFGKRKGFSVSFFPKKLSLFEWFSDQLKQNELSQLKQKYPYLF